MKPTLLFFLLVAASPGSGISDAEALAAGKTLMEGLGGRLKEALSASGPAGAIEVCSEEAMTITARLSKDQDLSVARITDRPRNPDNRASPEETALLDRMRHDLSTGTLAPIYDLGEARYLPLQIKPLCLTCHGEALLPEVTAMLRDRYPEDEATGYRLEELRGAIRIKKR